MHVSESVPGKYLVVSVVFDAVLQRNVHSIPAAFAQSCVTQVTCAYTCAHSYPSQPHGLNGQAKTHEDNAGPGKNPGENLCKDTVMTLDVKLKASSTPAGGTQGEIHHWRRERHVPFFNEMSSNSLLIFKVYLKALKILVNHEYSIVCASAYHPRDAGPHPHKGLVHISPSAGGSPTLRRSHNRNPKLHP